MKVTVPVCTSHQQSPPGTEEQQLAEGKKSPELVMIQRTELNDERNKVIEGICSVQCLCSSAAVHCIGNSCHNIMFTSKVHND